MFDMAASPCIQCRVDPELKLRLQAIAVERGLTQSAVIKRLVIGAIGVAPVSDAKVLAVEHR
jgi:antitoxin component of RelBE/YafQ-DinJ toxin-antitoxin module